MLHFKLNNNLTFPAIGFGTYKASLDTCSLAIEAGYRYFDTASIYKTESALGEALIKSGLKREEFIIASKLWKTDMTGYSGAKSAFERSLNELRTDYLDVYMMHWPRPDLSIKNWKELDLEIWTLFEELHSQGKIKTLGLSNFLPYHTENILASCKVMPSVIQLEFHPGHTQTFALNYYRKHNILVQAWSPIGRGRVFSDVLIQELSKKYSRSPAQICLRFCLEENVMPLPKASSLERLKENLDVLTFKLESEDVSRLENMPPLGWGGEHPDREREDL